MLANTVRMTTNPWEPRRRAVSGRIVVGVDGSPTSIDALAWAAGEAEAKGFGLHAVTCWSVPSTLLMGPYQPPISEEELRLVARDMLMSAIDKVLGAEPQVDLTTEVVQGDPALRLLELDADAEMIVVGSRGRGGFAGLLLGSVSQHLAEHARCPVVIIHRHEDDASAA
jgi:nucleotide-binding universal stress UspA family protein